MDTQTHLRPSRPPPKRVDAARNREKILAAARSAFAGSAREVSMAKISRCAGVGMATLYRNFSSRRELLEALYLDEVDAVCSAAKSVEAETPRVALVAWLHRFSDFFMTKRHVAEALLEHEDGNDAVFTKSRTRILAAGRPLLAAARYAHEIREDLTLEQILDLVVAIAKISGEPRYIEPILRAALDGLRKPR